jgi:hypothetical protein
MATKDMSSLSHSVCFHFFLLFLRDRGIGLKSMTLSFFLVILLRDILKNFQVYKTINLYSSLCENKRRQRIGSIGKL